MKRDLNDELLREIGFSTHDELKTFLQKVNSFFDTLTTAEKKVLRATLTDCVDAAKTFTTKVTAQELRAFIQSKEPDGAEVILCVHTTIRSRRKKHDETE
jgi:hypothetical protein